VQLVLCSGCKMEVGYYGAYLVVLSSGWHLGSD